MCARRRTGILVVGNRARSSRCRADGDAVPVVRWVEPSHATDEVEAQPRAPRSFASFSGPSEVFQEIARSAIRYTSPRAYAES